MFTINERLTAAESHELAKRVHDRGAKSLLELLRQLDSVKQPTSQEGVKPCH